MRIFTLLFLFLSCSWAFAQDNLSALMPMPNQVQTVDGKAFRVRPGKAAIQVSAPELKFAAQELQKIFQERMELEVPVVEAGRAPISLSLDASLEGKEHYRVDVSAKGIHISGATPGAVLYGVMTVDQLLLGDVCATARKEVTPVRIDDAPRFGYRALMLDPARHFLPVKDVKFYIDQMMRYKYNVLQLHLTDDQGWRIRIKKYPELASKAAYSQEELAELIRYAAQRNIEIIPELDVPGHTVAVLATHPDLGCTHTVEMKKVVGETVNLMLCANNEKVYRMYKDIIAEVAALFPSRYIHLGGDEAAIERNWTKCTRCQQMMKDLGYTKPEQLMIPFFEKILSYVEANGKSPMLWCELDNIRMPANEYLFPYPKNVTLVTWRMGLTPKCMQLTQQHGNPLIMAPGEYAYFDYPQLRGDLPEYNNWGMPVTTLKKSYEFDPGYGVSAADQAHILGVMGTLWGEAILDINRATYMTFPRGLALAEAGWTQMEHRSWESFQKRLFPNLTHLMKTGVSVRVPFEIIDRK